MDRRDALSYIFPAFSSKTSLPFLNSTVTRLWSVISPEMSWRERGIAGIVA
jgi:hypothetical protein